MITVFFRKLVALGLFIACSYILYLYGVSTVNSQGKMYGFNSPFQGHLPQRLSPNALLLQSQQIVNVLPEQSELGAISVLQQNPTSGSAATLLMSFYESYGRGEEADQVAELASKLWPSHTYTRSNLADYWLRRNRPDKQVEEWNVLLTRDRSFRKQLFPMLLEVAEREELSPLILPFTKKPPVWWDSFFIYLSRNLNLPQLERLYRVRLGTDAPLSVSEQNSYVARLIKERLWQAANDAWFIALTPNQMNYSALIYDGGFESDVVNQGFGWRFSASKNPRIKTDITYGIKGRKALQVVLRKQKPINFKHVSQRLILESGSYQLSFRYRTDTLKTTKGLSWRIRCVEGGEEVLGETIPLLGSNPWSTLRVDFDVPESCTVQLLRLEATSRFRHGHYFQGSAWFDDFVINKVETKSEEK